jgi:hypothetical protein
VPNGLAEIVRKKLDAGVLPRDQPLKVWAGIGSGKRCSACETPIPHSRTEYEAEYYDARPAIRFHAGCYETWEAERSRPLFKPDTAPSE